MGKRKWFAENCCGQQQGKESQKVVVQRQMQRTSVSPQAVSSHCSLENPAPPCLTPIHHPFCHSLAHFTHSLFIHPSSALCTIKYKPSISLSPYYHKVKVSLHPFKKALHHMSITCVTESNQSFTLPPLQSFSEIQDLLYLCFRSASIWLSPLTTRIFQVH